MLICNKETFTLILLPSKFVWLYLWCCCFYLAREFINYIAEAIEEKAAGIVAGKSIMSILQDGTKAWKDNKEEMLVLVGIERSGVPVSYVVSLLEMAAFGGASAEFLKLL